MWDCEYRPGKATYLLENGDILKTTDLGSHPRFLAGGRGGGVLRIDWNGDILWNFEYSEEIWTFYENNRLRSSYIDGDGNTIAGMYIWYTWKLEDEKLSIKLESNISEIADFYINDEVLDDIIELFDLIGWIEYEISILNDDNTLMFSYPSGKMEFTRVS